MQEYVDKVAIEGDLGYLDKITELKEDPAEGLSAYFDQQIDQLQKQLDRDCGRRASSPPSPAPGPTAGNGGRVAPANPPHIGGGEITRDMTNAASAQPGTLVTPTSTPSASTITDFMAALVRRYVPVPSRAHVAPEPRVASVSPELPQTRSYAPEPPPVAPVYRPYPRRPYAGASHRYSPSGTRALVPTYRPAPSVHGARPHAVSPRIVVHTPRPTFRVRPISPSYRPTPVFRGRRHLPMAPRITTHPSRRIIVMRPAPRRFHVGRPVIRHVARPTIRYGTHSHRRLAAPVFRSTRFVRPARRVYSVRRPVIGHVRRPTMRYVVRMGRH